MDRNHVQIAADILALYLADGPKPYREVKEHCRKMGLTRGVLKQARIELGVKTINTGETWLWEVPHE